MNIDYEAIAVGAPKVVGWTPNAEWVKAIIEAYEAQKNPPEWVPLDLSTVKQGQEVRHQDWSGDGQQSEFVCTYRGAFVTAYMGAGLTIRSRNVDGWLMRAPRPKTVHVRVFKMPDGEYVSTAGRFFDGYQVVGEGDIKVLE